jgi:hypothetical protein
MASIGLKELVFLNLVIKLRNVKLQDIKSKNKSKKQAIKLNIR